MWRCCSSSWNLGRKQRMAHWKAWATLKVISMHDEGLWRSHSGLKGIFNYVLAQQARFSRSWTRLCHNCGNSRTTWLNSKRPTKSHKTSWETRRPLMHSSCQVWAVTVICVPKRLLFWGSLEYIKYMKLEFTVYEEYCSFKKQFTCVNTCSP